MPTYQYACSNPDGKHEFEVVQSFTDAPVSECPECATPVRKVYGSVGVVFKGSGFYRTDSRKSSSSSESSTSSSTPSGSASSGSDGGGAKKDAKKESSSSSTTSSTTSGAGAKAASAG